MIRENKVFFIFMALIMLFIYFTEGIPEIRIGKELTTKDYCNLERKTTPIYIPEEDFAIIRKMLPENSTYFDELKLLAAGKYKNSENSIKAAKYNLGLEYLIGRYVKQDFKEGLKRIKLIQGKPIYEGVVKQC